MGLVEKDQSVLHDSQHGSCRSALSKTSIEMLQETGSSIYSFAETAAISDYTAYSGSSFRTAGSGGDANNDVALVQIVEKYATKLQGNPPPNEKTCLAAMQSLWNILRALNNSAPAESSSQASQTSQTSITRADVSSLAVRQGCIPALTSVMKTYKDSIKVQSRAVSLLGALGEDNASYQDVIAEAHGVSYVLAALVHPQHSKQSALCQEACGCLVNITSHSPRAVSQMAHGEGVQTLSATMKLHSKKECVQETALNALCNLARQRSEDKPFEFLELLEDAELIELVVDTMSRHKKVKGVMQAGGSFIHALATKGKPRTKASLVWSKAVPIVLKVLKYFPQDASMQLKCLESLFSLSYERPEALVVVAEDGCPLIFESMISHTQDEAIQSTSCQLLLLLCAHQHTCAPLSKCYKKNARHRKALQIAEQSYKDSCGDAADKIMKAASA